MSYQALYRKFRPGEFDEVKGQDHIVTTLRNQIKKERIGHAYLFCGTRGTGKTTVAKILAKAVNCEAPIDGSPCGQCQMCLKIASQTSMNVVEIDAASNNGVGNIRDIIEEVQYSPTEGKYKVYIIDEVHMLSTGAFNALLKTLEEPPSYVIFILATTEAHKIPITILSRCQRYDFKRISTETIAARLRDLVSREQVQAEDKALLYVAKVADGSMRDALSLLDQCIAFYLGEELTYDRVLEVLGAVDTEVYSRMFLAVHNHDALLAMQMIDEMMMSGRDLNQFLNEMIWYLRGLLLLEASRQGEEMLDVSSERLALMKEQAALTDADSLIRHIHILSELSAGIRYSTQKRVLVEVAFIKLCRPQMDGKQEMGSILSRLQHIEQQLESGVVNTRPAATHQPEAAPQTETQISPLPKAIPEDIKELLANWDAIQAQCFALERNMLSRAKKLLTDDGDLLLQFTEKLDEEFFTRENKKQLEALQIIIQNTIHKDLTIQTRTVTVQENNQMTDLSSLIDFDVTFVN